MTWSFLTHKHQAHNNMEDIKIKKKNDVCVWREKLEHPSVITVA